MTPTVSICLITYNHDRFVADALKGILEQQVDFPCELLIADDASTDETRGVIDGILSASDTKFKIRKLYAEKNSGMSQNFFGCISSANGKYIALCEGDDYWIDKNKLNKQISIMEANENISICFHRCEERDELGVNYLDITPAFTKSIFTHEELAKNNFIYTLSSFSRNYKTLIPDWVFDLPAVDYPFHLLVSKYGNIHFLNEVLGVYRKHQAGVWSPKSYQEKIWLTINKLLVPLVDYEIKQDLKNCLKENITNNVYRYFISSIDTDNKDEFLQMLSSLKQYIDFELLSKSLIEANIEFNLNIKKIKNSNSYKLINRLIIFRERIRRIVNI